MTSLRAAQLSLTALSRGSNHWRMGLEVEAVDRISTIGLTDAKGVGFEPTIDGVANGSVGRLVDAEF